MHKGSPYCCIRCRGDLFRITYWGTVLRMMCLSCGDIVSLAISTASSYYLDQLMVYGPPPVDDGKRLYLSSKGE